MAPLAFYLREAGVEVEAYDARFTEPLRSKLAEAGIEVLSEAHPKIEPDCVIHSSAIPAEASRVATWIEKETPIYRRGEFLGRRGKPWKDHHHGYAGLGVVASRFSLLLFGRRALRER